MDAKRKGIIIKLDFPGEQTIGEITKLTGLIKAKYLIPVIDSLDLEANPRSSRTGSVTDDIQESIELDTNVFPFKTKGILLASSQYNRLERGRIKIIPNDLEIEGILDGGHNTLAIGLYILEKALQYKGHSLRKGSKTWDQFKSLWADERDTIDEYLDFLKEDNENNPLDFFVPVELLVPRDPDDYNSVEVFKSNLLDICAARNNNVQLQVSAKANQLGYFDDLKRLMDEYAPEVSARIEWKTNDGGDIKAQDIIALAWIPLHMIEGLKDSNGRAIGPVAPRQIYAGKGSCLKQFEKLMSSPDVTSTTSSDYRRELTNIQVLSALRITVQLPALYDYIYAAFPKLYNAAGGNYGHITAVKNLTNSRKEKVTPFFSKEIETLSPDGFIMPLVYGLQALLEKTSEDDHFQIRWRCSPVDFLEKNLDKIVANYIGLFSMCDYDPQKIGKNPQSYIQAVSAFKMALAGII